MQYQQLGEDTPDKDDPRHIQSKEINPAGGSISVTDGQGLLGNNAPDEAELKRKKYIKWGIIGGIALIVVVLAIVLPLTLIKHNDDNGGGHGPLPPGNMNPYNADAGSISSAGSGASISGRLVAGKLDAERASHAVPKTFLQQLRLKDTTKKIGVDWRNVNFFGPNNMLINQLYYTVDVVTPGIGHLSIVQGNASRFSIPWSLGINNLTGVSTMRLEMLGVQLFNPNNKETFGIRMVDVNDGKTELFSTIGQTLLFADKYIQMDLKLPSTRVYGLGDRVHSFRLQEGAFTMWSSGQDANYDDGRGRGGLSGVHPFVLVQTQNPRRYIGFYFRNANAMTPVLRYNDDGVTSTLSFITIGGQIEMYFFAQGTAHEVVQAYQQFIGLAALPPFWALGWQEASPNMDPKTTDQASVQAAAEAYRTNGLPLDAVYLPSNSWDSINDFQLDATKYPNVQNLVTDLKNNKQRLVAYVDAAVNVKDRTKNNAYVDIHEVDGFIASKVFSKNVDGYLVNSKQDKDVVYYDWLNAKCSLTYGALLKGYSGEVSFDGLWTTMNEPFGELAGEKPASDEAHEQRLLEALHANSEAHVGGEESPYDQSWFFSFWPLNAISTYFLPFIPELTTVGNYDAQTLSLNATHVGGVTDYDVHSLYGHGMMMATSSALSMMSDNRPFILTKGSFSSTGMWAPSVAHSHDKRSWDSLYYGLASTLRSQMFGMPHSGSDVCGYYANGGQLDEELCLRWYQLATFFPLARHSQDDAAPRTEPFNLKDPIIQAKVKKTMHDRMQYLRLLYTCLFQASDSGGSCLDPVQFRYTVPDAKWNTPAGTRDFTSSYMVAGSLLVSPIMNALNGATTFQSYFPQGSWVNMADWSEIIQGKDDLATLQVRDTVNVHLAPGAVIPFQDNSDLSMMTTADVLAKPITLIANRDQNGQAGGSIFLDQGISRKEMKDQMYEYYNIQFQANTIQFEPTRFDKGNQPHILDKIVLVNAADLENVTVACYLRPDSLVPQALKVTPIKEKFALEITAADGAQPLKFSDILNIYFGSGDQFNLCNPHSFDYNIDGGVPSITNLQSVSMNLTHMGKTLDNITMTLSIFDQGIINIQWTWQNQTNGKRIPLGVPKTIVDTKPRDLSKVMDTLDKFVTIKDQPFQLVFFTKITTQPETVLTMKGLIFDEYLSWVNMEAIAEAADSEDNFRGVFGLGERATKNFFFKTGVYSMWAKDIDNPVENGRLPGSENYGVHPFYMFKHSPLSFVGVYHNLAQAQDWWINNDFKTGKIALSTIATGGLGDIFIFTSAQKPEDIIAKYHSLVGSPVLTPQWALGWNQCRWCYQNLGEVQQSTQGYIDNKIPLDTQWVDIDYMQDYKDFTYNAQDSQGNPGAFAGLPDFVNKLHSQNMKFVPIVDAGIAYRPNEGYQAFDQGIQQDVFLKLNGNVYVGKVWPNEATYPDFFHPSADDYWSSQLNTFHQSLPFDGLWQDMNEASNFCNGICHHDPLVASPVSVKLPYTPTGEDLETKAISLDVKHANGYTQLDAHSLFGTSQVRSSSLWFQNQKKRSMIISRSSFAGMGKFGSAWLGDNHATVDDMAMSVISVMNMNMFGIPLVGSDICGFGGDSTTAQLCARWHAVGAFYPFSRNHRACWGDAQEAWRFNNTKFDANHTYTDLMRDFIQRKYSLIRYYYTHMSMISIGNATYNTIYKPLFFEFPKDPNAYTDLINNVMIGKAIKTSVNAQDLTSAKTDFYFPKGTWCSLFTPVGSCIYTENGETVTLGSQLNESYAHIRSGYIVPMQNASALKAMTTVDLQKAPVDLHILGIYNVEGMKAWAASGFYYNDDGMTTNIQGNANQYKIQATYTQSKTSGETIYLTFTQLMIASNFFNASNNCSAVNAADWLQSIYIYNATDFKQHDTFWVSVSYVEDPDNFETLGQATFDATTNRIVFDGSVLGNTVCMTQVFRIAIRNLTPPTASVIEAE